MKVRTVVFALALVFGFTLAAEARQQPVSQFRKVKNKRSKLRKYKARKVKQHA